MPRRRSMQDHSFCREILKSTVRDVKDTGVEIPAMDVTKVELGNHRWFEVTRKHAPRRGRLLWCGNACCAWHAQSKALDYILTRAMQAGVHPILRIPREGEPIERPSAARDVKETR
jgi:hypothetical protein